MQALLDTLTPAERRAVALVALMIRLHGGREGEGLFVGPARYAVLAERIKLTASMARDVRWWWDRTATELRWPIGPMRYDEAVLGLIGPMDTDPDVLAALADRNESIVRIARQVVRRERTDGEGKPAPAFPVFDDPLDVFTHLDASANAGED